MSQLHVGVLALFLPLLGAASSAQRTGEARVPVLAELFTSEACSSCPPADQILEMLLAEQPIEGVHVVGLSEHVTYFDRQGWKDPFGSPRFTERQNAYAFRFNLESMFTPQLVIDGTVHIVGSDAAGLKAALAAAGRRPKPPLDVRASLDRDTVTASASGPGLGAAANERADLLWAITEDHLVVDVTRGENTGRTLRHSGVVRTMVTRKIDPSRVAEPMQKSLRLQPDWKRENLRVVAFVQSTKSKRVLSVGWQRLDGGR